MLWNKMASRYQRKAHPLAIRFARRLFSQKPIDKPEAHRLRGDGLGVAATTGAAAIIAAKHSANVTAIDSSDEMLRHLDAGEVDAIKAVKMDGQALAFPDESFDVPVYSDVGWRRTKSVFTGGSAIARRCVG